MNQRTCLSANNNHGELSAFNSDLLATASFTTGFDRVVATINYIVVRHLTLVVFLGQRVFSSDNDFTVSSVNISPKLLKPSNRR